VIVDNYAEGTFFGGGGVAAFGLSGNNSIISITGSTIQGNQTSSSSTSLGGGGVALFFVGATISDTQFVDNEANRGGGLYGTLSVSEVTIDNSEFVGNKAFGSGSSNEVGGGGIYVVTGSTLNLLNSTVAGNETTFGDGGGIWICAKVNATATFNVTNSTISGNRAPVGQGGGLWLATVFGNSSIVANLDHATITDNFASDGGGLFSKTSGVITTLNNTIVSGNREAVDINSAANNIAGAIDEVMSKYNQQRPTLSA